MVKAEPQQMIQLCHELLEQLDVESAIRVGDVYALMVEWFYSQVSAILGRGSAILGRGSAF
eukprot:3034318-Prymnesium_polylepis.1